MLLGRRDSTSASVDDANNDIPSPAFDVNRLVSAFKDQGLSARDMVALSGIKYTTHHHYIISIRELIRHNELSCVTITTVLYNIVQALTP